MLFDTSIVIDLLRGFPAASAFARGLDGLPSCSEITRVEVLQGLRSGERRMTERLFETIGWWVSMSRSRAGPGRSVEPGGAATRASPPRT